LKLDFTGFSILFFISKIGTGTPELALKTALHLYKDYSGLDINMGILNQFFNTERLSTSFFNACKNGIGIT
jgi:hypothetical protein